jgi:hypothetical protein
MKSIPAILFLLALTMVKVSSFELTLITKRISRVRHHYVPPRQSSSSRRHAAADAAAATTSMLDIKHELKELEEEFDLRVKLESLLWFFPVTMSACAFLFQQPTSALFHTLYAFVNENANGDALQMIQPALNGPVSTSISILFGTLVAITISSLYGRQDAMHKTLITLGEDLHYGSLLVQGLPPPYSQQAKEYLNDFSQRLCRSFLTGNYHILGERSHGLKDLVLFLNDVSQKQLRQNVTAHTTTTATTDESTMLISATIVSQLYDLVNRIQAEQAKLLATFRTTFPMGHYLNLTMLALAICTIFLMETDQAVLKFLDAFEIRTCWAILVGAFSMLGMVCYDLATPYSGIFRVSVIQYRTQCQCEMMCMIHDSCSTAAQPLSSNTNDRSFLPKMPRWNSSPVMKVVQSKDAEF